MKPCFRFVRAGSAGRETASLRVGLESAVLLLPHAARAARCEGVVGSRREEEDTSLDQPVSQPGKGRGWSRWESRETQHSSRYSREQGRHSTAAAHILAVGCPLLLWMPANTDQGSAWELLRAQHSSTPPSHHHKTSRLLLPRG